MILSINLMRSVYKDVFRELITINQCAKNCYKESSYLGFMRTLCCKGISKSVILFTGNAYKEIKCGNSKGYLCTAVKYGKRRDVVLQAYHLFSELRFCNGCHRKSFDVNTEICDLKQLHRHKRKTERQKRFYDLASWLYTLKVINRLDLNKISLEQEDDPGAKVRRTMFIGEGFIQCTAELRIP